MSIIKDRESLIAQTNVLETYIIEYYRIKYFINSSVIKTFDKVYIKNSIDDVINKIKEYIKRLYDNNSDSCGIDKNLYINNYTRAFKFNKSLVKMNDEIKVISNKDINKMIINDLNCIIANINKNNNLYEIFVYDIIVRTKKIINIVKIYTK